MNKTYSFSEENKRGSALEHMVACMFRTIGNFDVIEQYRTGTRSTIDGCRVTVDGYIKPCDRIPKGLMYECKAQDVSGSAHKRIPSHVIDAMSDVYPSPLIFIVDGAFFAKHNAGIHTVEWLRQQVDGHNILGVYNSSEFVTACQRGEFN